MGLLIPNAQTDFVITSIDNYFGATLEIIENDIEGVVKGIKIDNDVEMGFIKITSNDIELLNTEGNTGICINSAEVTMPNSSSRFQVENNTISKADVGIQVIDGMVPEIIGNDITINNTIFGSTLKAGISIFDALTNTRVWNSTVRDNTISTSSSTINTDLYGILAELTDANQPFNCNVIKRTGTAMQFANVINTLPLQINPPIYGNDMQLNHNCFVLTNNTELHDVGSSSMPSDNQWKSNNTGYHTYTDGSTNGNNTTLYTRGGGLPFEPTNNGSFTPTNKVNINTTASGDQYDCEGGGVIIIPGGLQARGNDSLPDFDAKYPSDTARWLAKYIYYKAMPADSNILNKKVQQFKDSVAASPLGKLMAWNRNDSLNTMKSRVQSLSTNNALEAKLQTAMSYKMAAQLENWDTLSTAVLNELTTMAKACPFEDGPAVYRARAMLLNYTGKQFYNACEGYTTPSKASKRIKPGVQQTAQQAIQVYPNPVNNELFVGLQLESDQNARLQLYDVSGRQLLDERLSNGKNSIAVNQLANGIYFYKIYRNSRLMKTEKLIIQ